MSSANWWLGTPGAMRQLPQYRNDEATAPDSLSDQIVVTADGGSTRVMQLHSKKTWSLPYPYLTTQEAALVDAFYKGLFGTGPFRLVDPLHPNVLGFDDSTMGMRDYAPIRWAASTGTLTRAPALAPAGVITGALQWSGLASGSILSLTSAGVVDILSAPVYVPAESMTLSVYVQAASAVSATLQLAAYDSTGALLGTPVAQALSLTTSWVRYSMVVSVGAFSASAAFVAPRLVSGGSAGVTLAAAQLEYGSLSNWQPGSGAPRVNITASPGHSAKLIADGYVNKTLVLAQT